MIFETAMAAGKIGAGVWQGVQQNSMIDDLIRASREREKEVNKQLADSRNQGYATGSNLTTSYNVERNSDKANMTTNAFLNSMNAYRQEQMGLDAGLRAERANIDNLKSQKISGSEMLGNALMQGAEAWGGINDKMQAQHLQGQQMDYMNAYNKKAGIDFQFTKAPTLGDYASKGLSGVTSWIKDLMPNETKTTPGYYKDSYMESAKQTIDSKPKQDSTMLMQNYNTPYRKNTDQWTLRKTDGTNHWTKALNNFNKAQMGSSWMDLYNNKW